jgi:hypothetical protein
MTKFILGFITALFLTLVVREWAGYGYLKYIDHTCGISNQGKGTFYCDRSHIPMAYEVHNWFRYTYVGDILTGRCNGSKRIKYFNCSRLQIWISNKCLNLK